MATGSDDKIRETVRKGYADIAQGKSGCCCGCSSPDALATAVGYTDEDLSSLPDGANMGLSCGNPTAVAELKAGQVVLDLGSGGGFDVFIAARKVGSQGKAIGIDMTPEMLAKARDAISKFTEKTGLKNVEFRLGEIEHLPVADNSVDVVISNCVINLSPDKQQVWREIYRALKPGGKACVSDLALKEEPPAEVKASVQALVGCVAGAVKIEETVEMMRAAGLVDVTFRDKPFNMDAMDDCNDALYKTVRDHLPQGKKLSDYVSSVDFAGYKNA
ncbi:MAG: arsenite methyltransferase [Phycisphaerae bacterium]|nr:arsenite methyltransferase [Phycisphaerae bacterium]